jgi:hypothetical protein
MAREEQGSLNALLTWANHYDLLIFKIKNKNLNGPFGRPFYLLQPSFLTDNYFLCKKVKSQKIKKELKNEAIVKGFNSQNWKFKK